MILANQDFYIDLLFYHLKLRCFVLIELKDKDFKPEYAGKMNFYLSAVDDLLKHETDQPSISLILNPLLKSTLSTPISLNLFLNSQQLPPPNFHSPNDKCPITSIIITINTTTPQLL